MVLEISCLSQEALILQGHKEKSPCSALISVPVLPFFPSRLLSDERLGLQ